MLNRTQRHRHAIEILARLTATTEHLGAATTSLRNAQPGYPTATGGGGSPRLDAAGNPPGLDRYLDVPDPAAHASRRIDTLLAQLLGAATELHSVVLEWALPVTDQPTVQRKASGGDCLACARFVSGSVDDRLRAGLCLACYQHHRRWAIEHDNADRGDWMLARRRELREADEPEVA